MALSTCSYMADLGDVSRASQAFDCPDVVSSFISRYGLFVFELLLRDRTTGRNIIWADDEYAFLGDGYRASDELSASRLTGLHSGIIRPRVAKALENRTSRTKAHAEVFTPSWLVNRMNNVLDEEWFGRPDAFNVATKTGWDTNRRPVEFPGVKGRDWHAYVQSTRLEITCGEAPFLCSRYDSVTGDRVPVRDRIGILDRKLRVVGERSGTKKTWYKWALEALRATYGYEYQGDNLLMARINVFETFAEHMRDRWSSGLADEQMDEVAWVVSWNLWQMDGLTCAPPTSARDAIVQSTLGSFTEPEPVSRQLSLFDGIDDFADFTVQAEPMDDGICVPLCIIYDWENNSPFEFAALKGSVI